MSIHSGRDVRLDVNDESTNVVTGAAKQRPVALGNPEIRAYQQEGTWHVVPVTPLEPAPLRITDRLVGGAQNYPMRTLVARRDRNGEWIRLSYAEMLERARRIGQSLLDRGLSAERPLVILSGNDLEHLQLGLGAMYAGIPYAPLSVAYSQATNDYSKLQDLIDQLTPGLVYASDGNKFGRAIAATLPDDAELVLDQGSVSCRNATRFADLLKAEPASVDDANARMGPDTIAKFLFTSGSTKKPKAVITTHGMLCINQQMVLQTFPFYAETPPVLVDWLPWSHCFGGSHIVGIAIYNGGTLYIDEGRATPAEFEITLKNLREIAPTAYLSIPKGFEMLTEALETDAALRDTFFSKVKLFFCAGAGLSQAAWDRLDAVALAHCGESIRIMTGLGMTETAPSCTFGTGDIVKAGYVGVPAPGCRVKLVPIGEKMEARFHGPHVTPGYWRAPHLTQEAFDEDGFYRTGDALRFVDERRPELGFMFDGRIAEDFKLSSGTFVSVGPLRARVIGQGTPYVFDAVVTGIDRDAIGLMVFPRMENCHELSGLPPTATPFEILSSDRVRHFFRKLLDDLNAAGGGSSNRVAMLLLQEEPPSIDHGELTDKGSINQAAVLRRRASQVDAMYQGTDDRVIQAG
ncbi:MAG TPA: feruloyl-CoA synthase [Noviherbaspirillum sp.]|jgi:feruloyl-CoA synthase|uniref:feruloyl-CoA synthase n=1 Tax=Noviherbaspirillum sp. TaxID=1926288 RepID=UPI002F94C0B5